MAYAMMGGIIIGTLLTLPFLLAFYVARLQIKEPEPAKDNNRENPIAPELQTDPSTSDAARQREMENA
jgi:hypothetical protein